MLRKLVTNLRKAKDMKAKVLLRSIGIGILAAAIAFTAFGFIRDNAEKQKDIVADNQTEKPADGTQKPDETSAPENTKDPETTAANTTQKPEGTIPGSDGEVSYTLKVEEGMSAWDVATQLAENGIIRNAEEFDEVMKNRGVSEDIKPGTYNFTNNFTYDQLITALTGKTK